MSLRLAPVVLVVAACGLAGPGPTAPPTNPPTPTPTVAPATTPTVAPTSDQGNQPPDGLLAAGGDPVVGWLGTFCWHGTCLDAPQLPDKSDLPILHAAAGEELTLTLADGTQFSNWSAVYASDPDVTGTDLGAGDAPVTSATFPAPPEGDWVVRVFVGFSDGDASYAWHVSVP